MFDSLSRVPIAIEPVRLIGRVVASGNDLHGDWLAVRDHRIQPNHGSLMLVMGPPLGNGRGLDGRTGQARVWETAGSARMTCGDRFHGKEE